MGCAGSERGRSSSRNGASLSPVGSQWHRDRGRDAVELHDQRTVESDGGAYDAVITSECGAGRVSDVAILTVTGTSAVAGSRVIASG